MLTVVVTVALSIVAETVATPLTVPAFNVDFPCPLDMLELLMVPQCSGESY